jgi:hypothetical protein
MKLTLRHEHHWSAPIVSLAHRRPDKSFLYVGQKPEDRFSHSRVVIPRHTFSLYRKFFRVTVTQNTTGGRFRRAPASSLIVGLATRDQSGLVAGHGWRSKAANCSQFNHFAQHNKSPRDAHVAASRVLSLAYKGWKNANHEAIVFEQCRSHRHCRVVSYNIGGYAIHGAGAAGRRTCNR